MHLNHGLVLAGVVALACGGNSKASSNPSAGVSSTGNGATTPSTGEASTSGSGVSTGGGATAQGPSAGSAGSTGGAAGTVGSTTSVTNGQGGSLLIPTGGAPATTGGSGGDGSETGGAGGAGGGCDEFGFWRRVARVVNGGLGSCGPTVCREGIVPLGSVVFDAEGHVSEFTGVDETLAEDLMQEFETDQWSCLAGESSEFCCFAR